MKDLKIYSVDEAQEPLLLKLVHNGGVSVKLAAVNSNGVELFGGNLITLAANGLVILHQGISKNLELPLDDKGRLKLKDYEEKAPVTFSDEEMRPIFDMRDKLRKDLRTATALQDHDDLSACLCVLEKMIEAFQFNQSIRLEPEAS